VGIVPRSRSFRKAVTFADLLFSSLELLLLSLRRSEKGKDAHFTSAALTSNQMYLLASGWHSGSAKLPTPTLLQSDGLNSRAVLYCLLAYRLSTWAAYESIHLKLSFQITAQYSSIIFLEKSLA